MPALSTDARAECDLDEGARAIYDEIQQAVQDRVRLIVKEDAAGRNYSESASSRLRRVATLRHLPPVR